MNGPQKSNPNFHFKSITRSLSISCLLLHFHTFIILQITIVCVWHMYVCACVSVCASGGKGQHQISILLLKEDFSRNRTCIWLGLLANELCPLLSAEAIPTCPRTQLLHRCGGSELSSLCLCSSQFTNGAIIVRGDIESCDTSTWEVRAGVRSQDHSGPYCARPSTPTTYTQLLSKCLCHLGWLSEHGLVPCSQCPAFVRFCICTAD